MTAVRSTSAQTTMAASAIGQFTSISYEARIKKDIALGGDFQAVELVNAAVRTYSHVEKAAGLTIEFLAQLPLISSWSGQPKRGRLRPEEVQQW